MNSLVLGGVLKRIYPDFNMNTFTNRLKLQKIIYLLQQSNINIGYVFSFYIYGPYCPELTRDAFQIQDFNEVKSVGFEEDDMELKFKDFLEKIEPFKEDIIWLEVASSIHLLKKLYPEKSKAEIINEIANKRLELNDKKKEIDQVWKDMTGWLI